MNALLIINPISGTRKKTGLDRFIIDRLAPLGWDISVAYTRGRGDATSLAAQAVNQKAHAVIVVGGDGTVNEAAKSLCNSSTALGIIPSGSGNGLARHLGIPLDIRGAIDTIGFNHVLNVDYATVNDTPFFCTFGIGFDAAVSETFSRHKRRGKLSYIRSTFETYSRFTPEKYTIEANGQMLTDRAFLVAVCNASQYGNNAYIAPQASIVDGLLDVTVIHAGNPLATALVGVDMLTGFINKNTLIQTIRTRHLTITRHTPGATHLDGEPVNMGEKLHIECHHKALPILAPDTSTTFKPILTPVSAMIGDIRNAISNIIYND